MYLVLAVAMGCAPSGKTGSTQDGGGADAVMDSCPVEQPPFGAMCKGILSCAYGKSSCCGNPTTDKTCTCEHGFFFCTQTVECNVVCPDAGQG
jgi:hypothetical protein